MKLMFKLLQTLNSTSWVIVVYGIKEKWSVWGLPYWVFSVILLLTPVFLSFVSILVTKAFSRDELKKCQDVQSANVEYLAVYLGYLFVGLGIDEITTLIFVYVIIFLFSALSHSQYFNPMLLLLGYKFYHITTASGTKAFLISKKEIRNLSDASFESLRRINDTTYIDESR